MTKNKTNEPQYINSLLNNRMLNYRVYKMSGIENLIYRLLTIVIGGIVGLIFFGGLFKSEGNATIITTISNFVVFFGVGLLSMKLFIPMINESLRQKRLVKLKTQFRDFLVAIAASLSSGMTINTALADAQKDLKMQYPDDSLIVIEVKEIMNGLENNFSLEEMFSDFGKRTGIDDINNFSIVFSTCFKTGGNIKDVVLRTADIISEKIIISEEIRTKITSNKLQLRAMTVIPVVVVLMMRVMSSEFAKGFSSGIGIIAMCIGVAIFVGAYKIGEKIMNVEG